MTVNATATTAEPLSTVTLLCAWCRRDSDTAGTQDSRAIVGLCDDHVKGFFARVDELLASCAALRKKKVADAETPAEEAPDESLPNLLRRNGGLTFCDACLGAELDWPAERVTSEADALDRSEFLRDQWRCARCGARGLVTRARTRRSYILENVAKKAA